VLCLEIRQEVQGAMIDKMICTKCQQHTYSNHDDLVKIWSLEGSKVRCIYCSIADRLEQMKRRKRGTFLVEQERIELDPRTDNPPPNCPFWLEQRMAFEC